jgi:hypothetical protein
LEAAEEEGFVLSGLPNFAGSAIHPKE